ncbi:MAG TPA: family 43 glycosylhydrolase [Nocardioides sp.]|nr:family 43 glycosylhydrolase [Nocardioides sp.]
MSRTRWNAVLRRPLALIVGGALAWGALSAPATAHAATSTAPVDADPGHLVASYALDETSGTTAADSSGNGHDGTYEGSPTLTGGEGVKLDGTDDDVKLPNNIMAGLSSITVSTDVLIRSSQATSYMIWAFGNATSGVGNGYLFATGDAYRAAIASGNWSTEQGITSGTNLTRGTWQHIAYTIDSGTQTATLYLNGTAVKTSTGVTLTPASIGSGVTTLDYLGRSVYTADKRLAGSLRNFQIYDEALTSTQVASLVPSADTDASRDAAWAPGQLGDVSAVKTNLTLPTSGPNGSTITWSSSDPAHLSATGVVTRPAGDDEPITLTATATKGGATETGQVVVTVLADNTNVDAQDDLDAITIPDAGDVRGNITLPSTGTTYGSAIQWSASPAGIVSTTASGGKAAGVVTRPATDTTVTLTATVAGTTATRSIPVTVVAAPTNLDTSYDAGYLFAHFEVTDYEKVYFGYSSDGLHFADLNGNQAIMANLAGTLGVRDPSIIRSPEGDRYWVIGTDLHAEGTASGGSWDQLHASQKIGVWESDDLVHWTFNGDIFAGFPNAGNVWAPEATYDAASGQYYVYWAARDQRDYGTDSWALRTYLTKTRDFRTFTTPVVWDDESSSTNGADGPNAIDPTIVKDGDTYYRFIDQDWNTLVDTATSLDGPWTRQIAAGEAAAHGLSSHIEGLTVYQLPNKHWVVMGDSGGYTAYETTGTTLAGLQFTALSAGSGADQYSFAQTFRHGTVMQLSQAEQDRLMAAYGPPQAAPTNADGQILHYDFSDGSGTTLSDVSGNHQDAAITGTGGWDAASHALAFNGTDTYVTMPKNLMTGLTSISVEAEVYVDPAQATPYFIYGMGNTSGTAGNGYLFTTGNAYRTSIAGGTYTTEQTASSGANLPRGQWENLVYTLDHGTATIYLNGVAVATKTGVTVTPGDLGGGTTVANFLGKSLYSGDKLFRGEMKDFAIWNRALTPDEISAFPGNDTQLSGFSLSDPSVLKVAPIIDATDRVVTFPVNPGTDLTELAPTFTSAATSTVAPASGTTEDLSSPVTYTVTGSGGTPVTWTFKAVEMQSPVLPGYYADPNIVVFGGTYYIYATTDGYPGWGGSTFYAWHSTDLVHWTRSGDPILTLDGGADQGHVPWATGNAWAPTIIERDGKYYFYFSGQNPTYNRKTLGVAVADSPDGPFTAEPTAMVDNNESVTTGQAIDSDVFQDPGTGRYWLIWGNGGGGPILAQLNDDMTSVDWSTATKISGLSNFTEGSFLNYRNGIYYLSYSVGDTGNASYHIEYATASSLAGPWTSHGTILSQDPTQGIYATGHASIIQVPGTDDWYIAYHRFGIPGGDGTHRETTIDRLTFNADGTIAPVTPTLASVDPEAVPDPSPLTATIAGEAKVGATLTAVPSDGWTASGYQWTLDGEDISGATASAYTPVVGDAGHVVGVRVDATKSLWPDATASAAGVTIAAPSVADTTVTARLAHSSIAYGAADSVTVTVTGGDTTPTGTIALYAGARQLSTAALAGGSGTLAVPARSLAVGVHPLTVRYLGDAGHAGSSQVVTLAVRKAAPRIRVIPKSAGRTLVLTVRVTTTAGVTVRGTVQVRLDGKSRTARLGADGAARIVVRDVRAGTYRVVTTYGGSPTVASATLRSTVRTR